MRPPFLLLALAFCVSFSCKHAADSTPQCYAGTVVGTSYYDGVIINVDAQFPIGKPVGDRFALYDSTKATNQNVIGGLNSNELAGLSTKGTRIFFTCTGDTQGFSNFGPCNHMGIPLPVPHVVLTSFSATPCGPVAP